MPNVHLASSGSKNSLAGDVTASIPKRTNQQASLCHVTSDFGHPQQSLYAIGHTPHIASRVIPVKYMMVIVHMLYPWYPMIHYPYHLINYSIIYVVTYMVAVFL